MATTTTTLVEFIISERYTGRARESFGLLLFSRQRFPIEGEFETVVGWRLKKLCRETKKTKKLVAPKFHHGRRWRRRRPCGEEEEGKRKAVWPVFSFRDAEHFVFSCEPFKNKNLSLGGGFALLLGLPSRITLALASFFYLFSILFHVGSH